MPHILYIDMLLETGLVKLKGGGWRVGGKALDVAEVAIIGSLTIPKHEACRKNKREY